MIKEKPFFAKKFKDLVVSEAIIYFLAVLGVILGKNTIANKITAYGFPMWKNYFFFILMYLVEFATIFFSTYNYKLLLKNNQTTPSKLKFFLSCIVPILVLALMVLLGIIIQ